MATPTADISPTSKACKEGTTAFQEGKSLSENPYAKNGKQRDMWTYGWHHGQAMSIPAEDYLGNGRKHRRV